MAKKKKQSSNLLEVQNAAKTLYANIRFMSVDKPIKTLVVTSSVPNEGKSTTSVELVKAIATSGKRVALVDADMRRRSLATYLGVRAKAGLYAVASGQLPLEQAAVPTGVAGLDFFDVEPNIPNPADFISSKRFRAIVGALEEAYDFVLFDTPPVGTFVDAAILSTLVDATVLVVRVNAVRRDELLRAYEQLQKADVNVIGFCATFVEGTGSEYYYAYYTEDGRREKTEKNPVTLTQPAASSKVNTAPAPRQAPSQRSHRSGGSDYGAARQAAQPQRRSRERV